MWLASAISLCRCYRETGDLARAIDTGEDALRHLEEYGLDGTDEAVQLAVTLAAAHFERGDVSHAVRQCQRAIEHAERLDSPKAKASAYWNASMMKAEQGAVEAAVPMAQKALALLESADDNRNLARLRSQLGQSQLQLDPPAVADARAEPAARRPGPGVVQREPGRHRRATSWRSRGHTSSPGTSRRRTHGRHRSSGGAGRSRSSPRRRGSCAARSPPTRVTSPRPRSSYREAVLSLTAVGADRGAAQLWFELAGLLEEIGDAAEAPWTPTAGRPRRPGSPIGVRRGAPSAT